MKRLLHSALAAVALLGVAGVGCSRREPGRPLRGVVVAAPSRQSVVVRMESVRSLKPGDILTVSRGSGATTRYLGFLVVTRIDGLTVICEGDNDTEPLGPGDHALVIVRHNSPRR